MIVKVTHNFRDKFHYPTEYTVGQVVTFDKERAQDIIKKGLAEVYEEEKPKENKPKVDKPKKAKNKK